MNATNITPMIMSLHCILQLLSLSQLVPFVAAGQGVQAGTPRAGRPGRIGVRQCTLGEAGWCLLVACSQEFLVPHASPTVDG